MRRFFLSLLPLSALWAVVLGSGCQHLSAFVGAPPGPRHMLWVIETPSNRVYLLGSVHLLRPDIYPLAAIFEEAYEDAELVAFETDLTPGSGSVMLTRGLLPDSLSLQRIVQPETYRLIKVYTDSIGLQLDLVNRLKPWMAAFTLSSLHLIKNGFDPELGIDKHFFERASQDQKLRFPLETMNDQADIFDLLPPIEQEAFLYATLQEMSQGQSQLDTLTARWLRGDAKGLEKLLSAAFRTHPNLRQRINGDRNRAWLPQIESFIGQDFDALVIVGTLHLVGDEGLIELLQDQNHTVRQL